MYSDRQLEGFLRESNAIEGEVEDLPSVYLGGGGRLNPGDLTGAKKFLSRKLTEKSLLEAHQTMFGHRMDDAGSYRLYNVRVGRYVAPDWKDVPGLMAAFWKDLPKLDSWMAHNRFEKVHPFGDGNGRMGRLIWLHKAASESVPLNLPFLHRYYYQTLERAPA